MAQIFCAAQKVDTIANGDLNFCKGMPPLEQGTSKQSVIFEPIQNIKMRRSIK